MTKQRQIEILQEQINSLHVALNTKDDIIEDLKIKLFSLPHDIEEEHYQNFKDSDLAKNIERFIDELINKNLKINGNEETQYNGYYDSNLIYKDKVISSFSGQIYMGRNTLED